MRQLLVKKTRQTHHGIGALHDQHLRLGSETHRRLHLGPCLGGSVGFFEP